MNDTIKIMLNKLTMLINFVVELFFVIFNFCLARYIRGVIHRVSTIRDVDKKSGVIREFIGVTHGSGVTVKMATKGNILIIIILAFHGSDLILSDVKIGTTSFSIC